MISDSRLVLEFDSERQRHFESTSNFYNRTKLLFETILPWQMVKDTYRTVTPYLVVPNADVELTFLKAAVGGTEVTCQRNADNTVMHAEVTIGDSLVMLGQAGGQWTPRAAALYPLGRRRRCDLCEGACSRGDVGERTRRQTVRRTSKCGCHRPKRGDVADRRPRRIAPASARRDEFQ